LHSRAASLAARRIQLFGDEPLGRAEMEGAEVKSATRSQTTDRNRELQGGPRGDGAQTLSRAVVDQVDYNIDLMVALDDEQEVTLCRLNVGVLGVMAGEA